MKCKADQSVSELGEGNEWFTHALLFLACSILIYTIYIICYTYMLYITQYILYAACNLST